MATIVNTNIKNDTDGYLLDAKNVKGGYLSVDTLANLQSFSLSTKEAGSFAYVRENSKFYIYDGASWQETKFYDDTEIKNIIPVEANVNNKLADKNYVSERMAQISSGTAIHSYDVMFALFAQYIYDKLVADGINVSDDTIMHLIKQSITIGISNSTTEININLDEALTNANLDIDHIMSLANFDYIDNKIKTVKGSFMVGMGSSWNYIDAGNINIVEMFTTHGITEMDPLSQTFKLKSANIGDNIYIVSPGVPDLWLAMKTSSTIVFMSLDSSVDLSNIESSVSSINTEINSVKTNVGNISNSLNNYVEKATYTGNNPKIYAVSSTGAQTTYDVSDWNPDGTGVLSYDREPSTIMGRDIDGKAYADTNIVETGFKVSYQDQYQLINKSYADHNYVRSNISNVTKNMSQQKTLSLLKLMMSQNYDPSNKAHGITVHPGETVCLPLGRTLASNWNNSAVQAWLNGGGNMLSFTIWFDGTNCWPHLANDFSAYPLIEAAYALQDGIMLGHTGNSENYITIDFKDFGYYCGEGLEQLFGNEMKTNGQYVLETSKHTYPSTSPTTTETRIVYLNLNDRSNHTTVFSTQFPDNYDLSHATGILSDQKKISAIPEQICISMDYDGTIHACNSNIYLEL